MIFLRKEGRKREGREGDNMNEFFPDDFDEILTTIIPV